MQLLELRWWEILIAQVLPRLSLRDCFALRSCSRDCRHLVDLHLGRLETLRIVDRGYFSRDAFKTLHRCARVQNLNLARCTFLDDELLVPLLAANRRLAHVNLSQCVNLSSRSLQPIMVQSGETLRSLKLTACRWLTTGAVEALALHASRVERLDLSYCDAVAESAVVLLLRKFKDLETLSLRGVTAAGDRCMYAAAKFSKRLRHLNVDRCPRVTDSGVTAVARHCTRLETLSVRACHLVTEASLAPIRCRVAVDRQPQPQLPLWLQA